MGTRRLLPYLVVLVILAIALGSLSRTQPGGSLLFRSYWLLYLVYLIPVAALAGIVVLIVIIAWNWRDLSEGLGHGIARKRRMRKPRSWRLLAVQLFFWSLAAGFLLFRRGAATTQTTNLKEQIVGAGTNNNTATLGIEGTVPMLTSLIQMNWFIVATIGLLVLSGIVMLQSARVAFRESGNMDKEMLLSNRVEGAQAVEKALGMLKQAELNPRARIISCFQHLILTASRLGAHMSPDMTARELEKRIRSLFALRGMEIGELTKLFEEARYSEHPITEQDANQAYEYLVEVGNELNIQVNVEH
ncbi:MAG TPA: DUF4129 domain-containing protein [Candidatus Bathyarchaeia archaeon]|nr:DUF4129 domain-containing protein [Candidatus Bathyarchaeia archaeon]